MGLCCPGLGLSLWNLLARRHGPPNSVWDKLRALPTLGPQQGVQSKVLRGQEWVLLAREAMDDHQWCTPSTYGCLLYARPVHWGLDASGSSLECDSNCFGNLQQMFSFLARMLPHFPYVLHETSPDFPPPSRDSGFAINPLPGWQVCRPGSWGS